MTQQEPAIELKAPRDCSASEFAEFCRIVKEGKQVDPNGLKGRMRDAEVLAFLRRDDKIVGVGALKKRPAEYTANKFGAAKSANHSGEFDLELGWVVVLENGHKHSYRITAELMKCAGSRPLYATSRATRVAMHKALEKNGFKREGGEWPSERADPPENLFLFIHKGKVAKA